MRPGVDRNILHRRGWRIIGTQKGDKRGNFLRQDEAVLGISAVEFGDFCVKVLT